MKRCLVFWSTVALSLFALSAGAEELNYRPVNPQFGGSPLNGNPLLAKAQAQNDHTPPDRRRNSAEMFEDSVQQAILSRVSREIADSILGEGARDSGSFELGGLMVDYERDAARGEVSIQLNNDGRITQIKIPTPTY